MNTVAELKEGNTTGKNMYNDKSAFILASLFSGLGLGSCGIVAAGTETPYNNSVAYDSHYILASEAVMLEWLKSLCNKGCTLSVFGGYILHRRTRVINIGGGSSSLFLRLCTKALKSLS